MFYKSDFSYGTEPGDFKVYVGGNSEDVLENTFKLIE
jgi:beta-glucosidase